jgi:hypothetical protein
MHAQMMEDVSVSQPWLVSSEASALPLPPVAMAVQVRNPAIILAKIA